MHYNWFSLYVHVVFVCLVAVALLKLLSYDHIYRMMKKSCWCVVCVCVWCVLHSNSKRKSYKSLSVCGCVYVWLHFASYFVEGRCCIQTKRHFDFIKSESA